MRGWSLLRKPKPWIVGPRALAPRDATADFRGTFGQFHLVGGVRSSNPKAETRSWRAAWKPVP